MSTSYVPKPPGPPIVAQDPSSLWVPYPAPVSGELKTLNNSGALVRAGSPIQRALATGLVLGFAGIGQPVRRAQGIVIADAADGQEARYVVNGRLSLPDWTFITGTMLLVANAIYYLDAVAGRLTTVLPVRPTFGLRQVIGQADDVNTLDIYPDSYEVDL